MANAQQVDWLTSGSRKADGTPNTSGLVYFYEPGTTTFKAVWNDAAKTDPSAAGITSVITLDANGAKELYADGAYDIKVEESDNTDIITIDNAFYSAGSEAGADTTRTVSSSGDILDTDTIIVASGNITLTFASNAADLTDGKKFIIIKTDSSNTVTINPKAASGDTFNGASSIALDAQYNAVTLRADINGFFNVTSVPVHDHADALTGGTAIGAVTLTSATLVTPTIDNGITMNGDAWPSFHAFREVQFAITTGVETDIVFDTDDGTDNSFDSNDDFDATTGIFTPTVAGKYLLQSTCEVGLLGFGSFMRMRLYYGTDNTFGTSTILDEDLKWSMDSTPNARDVYGKVYTVVEANGTGESFKVTIFHDHGSNRNSGSNFNCNFTGSRIA